MDDDKRKWVWSRFRSVRDCSQRAFDEMTNVMPMIMYLQAQARMVKREAEALLAELDKLREQEDSVIIEEKKLSYGKKAKPE